MCARSSKPADSKVPVSWPSSKASTIATRRREWIGAEIFVARAALPECAPDEYYWTDLEGLEVRTPTGERLGTVDHLLATGSNDVLVLAGAPQRLIPFVLGTVIRNVDLEGGFIVADWSPDY